MSDLKKIEDAARHYANSTRFMSNYPHDWNSAYDGYIRGAMDMLQPKQANAISDNHEALPIQYDSKFVLCRACDSNKVTSYDESYLCRNCGYKWT